VDLQTFIAESLRGIADGVHDANVVTHNGKTSRTARFVLHPSNSDGSRSINFDIAVVVRSDDEAGTKGGGKVSVLPWLSAGLEKDGRQSSSQEHISRIRFAVQLGGTLS
jgi:hypothetical protein